MKYFFLILAVSLLFSCASSRSSYYYYGQHYLDLVLVLNKSKEFEIVNLRRKTQPFGFSITGTWVRLSDSAIQLNVNASKGISSVFLDSIALKQEDNFNWETYRKYGNNYLFPYFKVDTLYEFNKKRNVRLRQIILSNKPAKIYLSPS
jgi:hypothetical protein